MTSPEIKNLIRKEIKKTGKINKIATYVMILIAIAAVEFFASYNIHVIHQNNTDPTLLRDVFSVIAVIVVAFTVIENIVFLGGKNQTDREMHYHLRTKPLMIFSITAVIGDIIAISLIHKTGFFYVVFFSSLIGINIFAIAFAIYSVEHSLKRIQQRL